ncbi:DNA repair protein RadC [Alkanindiges sp. WGS2144]|uniref:RadC family protein n=1 Tax=Alkanindiges sp. WGS2144 TaxID=3366808 RepID=UPI0037510E98
MSIKSWPASERPRERLLNQGAAALSDAELLAIFLRTGSVKASAIDMARHMINEFGSLFNLLNASQQQLMACHGMGEAKVAHLFAALELGRRYVSHQMQQSHQLNDPALVKHYCAQHLRHEPREVFAVMFLDSQLRLIHFEKIFYGSITQCSVHIREIMRLALMHQAVNLIVTHNHPDAEANPSPADIHLTQQLDNASHLLEIKLIDHVVVGQDQVFSFAEHALMP